MLPALTRTLILGGILAMGLTTAIVPPAHAQDAVIEDYIPPELLDPNLQGVEIRRLQDRVAALEATQERLVDRTNLLTDRLNAVLRVLNGEVTSVEEADTHGSASEGG